MADIVTMPKLGFDMAEGTLVRWVKAESDTVEKGQVLAEIETDKATVEVESSFTGVVLKHLAQQGAIVPVGAPIAAIGQPGETVEAAGEPAGEPAAKAPTAPAAAPAAAKETAQPVESDGRLKASPLARRMATDQGLDLRGVQGTGPEGRIVKRDVEAALAAPAPAAPAARSAGAGGAVPLPAFSAATVEDEVVGLDRLRQAIGRRMVESKTSLPHFYVTHQYNMAPVMALRSQLNALLPDDQKLTVNDFIVRAVALSLRQFPNINASIEGTSIRRHGHVNVGVAVAVEGGLLTVVVRDADQKSLRLISSEVRDMVGRARIGKVRPDDIEGSTFSISNLGMFDVEHFIAIINPPEAAILAIGSVKQAPVVTDGQLAVGTVMKATISADHRVTDGAEAAQFMQSLAKYLEEPMRLVI